MSSSAKWFDLSEASAKLERVEDSGGSFHLELYVEPDRVAPFLENGDPYDLPDKGWLVQPNEEGDAVKLVNYAPINRKSEVVSAIRPFFTESEIDAAHVSIHEMKQGERVEGLEARQLISEGELRDNIHGVDPEDRDRILASVQKAQQAIEQRAQKQAEVLFGGRGRELYTHLVAVFEDRGELGKIDASNAAAGQLLEAIEKPNGVHATRLNMLTDAVLADSEENIEEGDNYVLGRIGDSPEDFAMLAEMMGELREDAEAAFEGDIYGDLVNESDYRIAEDLNFPPELMDKIELPVAESDVFEYYKQKLPFDVIRDSAVPSAKLGQSMAAVDKALDVIANELELPRDKIVPDQKSVPMRFSYDAVQVNRGVVGSLYTAKAGDDENEAARDAMVMNLSVTRGRSFTHEFGHLVDMGNSLTDEERHAILSNSGVLMDVQHEVDRRFPEGGEHALYLKSEPEVFARTFDAHFVNLARSNGDDSLKTMGGLHTTSGIDAAAPYGDLEKTNAFISELRDALALKRDVRHEAEKKANLESKLGSGQGASFSVS